jgi:hypothetical protein
MLEKQQKTTTIDYEKQLDAFYSLVDFKPLSSKAISMYNFLLHIAYKTDWVNEFTVANTTIMSKLHLTQKELQTARNELITKKYIIYKKGSNQNKAPKYSIISLYEEKNSILGQAEVSAKVYAEGNAEVQATAKTEGNIITKLNLYFIYIIYNKGSQFKNIVEADKKAIVAILKKLELYIDEPTILEYMTEEQLLELKIQYWVIKELYFSPYKICLNYLTRQRFMFRFLKARKYVQIQDTYKFLNYCIKSFQEDLYANKKEVEADDKKQN